MSAATASPSASTGSAPRRPADDLFKHFGFTAEAIVPQIVAALKA